MILTREEDIRISNYQDKTLLETIWAVSYLNRQAVNSPELIREQIFIEVLGLGDQLSII